MRRRSAIFAVLIVLSVYRGDGAFEDHPVGARAIGLGGHSSALSGDLWAGVQNPSLLSGLSSAAAGFSIVPGIFGMNELSRAAFGFGLPVGPVAIGAYGSRFGFDLYEEYEAGVMISSELSPQVSVGVAARLYALSIPGYGKASCIGLSAGALISFSPRYHVGLRIENMNCPRIGAVREPVPPGIHIGLAVNPADILLLTATVSQEAGFPLEAEGGIEVTPVEPFRIRAGVAFDPMIWSGGCGFRLAWVEAEYGIRWHPDLGLTHALTLNFFIDGL